MKLSKYEALGDFLRKQPFQEVPMTFSEVERVTGVKLPPKAQHHRAWWSNNPSNNVMTKIWLDAGFRTERVDMAARKLVFKRASKSRDAGMADAQRQYQASAADWKGTSHPLFGCMKGTFTIEPGWDLTKPAMDPEEIDEMEANLERTADRIEKGMRRK